MKMIDCSQPWQSSKLAMCRSKQISLKSYLRLFNISQIFPRVVLYINCWMSTSGRQHKNVRNLLIQINLLNRLLYLKEQQSPISFWFSVRGLFNRILRCQIHTSMHCGFFSECSILNIFGTATLKYCNTFHGLRSLSQLPRSLPSPII